ncbi:hypothetical protein ACFC06_25150 [Nocardia sp. NPDC056064]|uniref:hypothetical protein n=1 Tax=Nocardia sp. NPDC056064 TaxID=3345701 RepID=UPI0035D91CAC
MRGKAVGAAVLGALVLGGVVVGILRSGDMRTTVPTTGQDLGTMTAEPRPARDDDYDPDLEDPVIDLGKPTTWEEFAEDSQAGMTPGEYEDGPKGLEGGPLWSTENP